MSASSVVIVLTTFPADGDPLPLARALVEERLAACVNVLPPMTSVYRWKDAVEEAGERQLIIKTSRARLDELQRRIAALHPYELPELLVVAIDGGGDAYLEWLRDAVRD